jgi:hypothetical protein
MWNLFIVSIIISICAVILMPKKISKIEIYTSYFFALMLTWSINIIIDIEFNLRGFFQKGPDYPTILTFMIIFSCCGIIFLNFYPYMHKSIIKKSAYIFLSVSILFVYELLLLKFNIMYHNNWKYTYSFLQYTIYCLCFLLNIKIIRHLNRMTA